MRAVAMPLPDHAVSPRVLAACRDLALASPWWCTVFAFIGGFVQTWGRDYTPTLVKHFATAFSLQWGDHWPGDVIWAGTAWNSLFTTLKLAAIAAPICARLGLLISWVTGAHAVPWASAPFEFSCAAGVCHPRHGAGRELHPGLQRAAV